MEDQRELDELSSIAEKIIDDLLKVQDDHLNKPDPSHTPGPSISTVTSDGRSEIQRSAAPAKTKVIFAIPVLIGLLAPLAPIAVQWGVTAATFLLPLLLNAIGSVVVDMLSKDNNKKNPKIYEPSKKPVHHSNHLPLQTNSNDYYIVVKPSTGQYMLLPEKQLTTPWNPAGQFTLSQNPGGQYPTHHYPSEYFTNSMNPGNPQYPIPQNPWEQFPAPQNPWVQNPSPHFPDPTKSRMPQNMNYQGTPDNASSGHNNSSIPYLQNHGKHDLLNQQQPQSPRSTKSSVITTKTTNPSSIDSLISAKYAIPPSLTRSMMPQNMNSQVSAVSSHYSYSTSLEGDPCV